MPFSRPASSPRAAALSALALLALVALLARPDAVAAGAHRAWVAALADTDSVAVPGALPAAFPEATEADTTDADSTDADTLSAGRAETYFPRPASGGWRASVAAPYRPGIRGRLGTYWGRDVALDTARYAYNVTEAVAGEERAPAQLTLDEFLEARRSEVLGDQFRTLAAQRADRQQRGRTGLGFAVDIPGGEQGAFRTIFGKNEVALTVNGASNVNLGVRYDQSDLEASTRSGSNFNPDFGQDLNLNVAGTVGDKLAINVNYDTGSTFDFENQVSLVYTGYDDDIVQRFEAGNVFLQTPSTLIRGGQRLFGLRTDLQFGPLAVTAVASQQDAETTEFTFEGGADAQAFSLPPYRYENNTHFFVGYAFHNWWDRAHARPQNPSLPPGLVRFVGIEVWKHEPGLVTAATEDVETTWAIALADLGEPAEVLAGGEAYLGPFNANGDGRYANDAAPLPDPALDQYLDLSDERANGATASAASVVENGVPLPTGAFSNNVFRKLRANVDYTFDSQLGWLSLTTSLTDSDLLAVSYRYENVDGEQISIGDYGNPAQSSSQTGPRTILKLLRADRPTPTDPLWDLTMRNVYRIGGRSLSETSLDLDIEYKAPGSTADTAPPVGELSFEQLTFLQVLGLDRVNGQGLTPPDEAFDFRAGVTVDPVGGRVIFPVRQPFGDYLENLIRTGWTVGAVGNSGGQISVGLGSLGLEEALSRYVPTVEDATEASGRASLYDLQPSRAEDRLSRLSAYQVVGEYKSATQSVFNIGFQLVPNTVRVTSGELELVENQDYRVNYTSGTVEITNPTYLQPGQNVRVSVEQNQLISIGSKTLLGLRADYRISEDFSLGGTWMRLSERPLGDKFRIGEEALSNTIVGLDGQFRAEPRWLTRAVDALPLIQTRAASRIELRGEVARLTPGTPETFAFGRARDALRDAGLDFAEDELSGISYIDDFEGSENAYTALSFPIGWSIAAPPTGAGRFPNERGDASSEVTDPRIQSNWRGLFAWYSMSESVYDDFRPILTRATREVAAGDLYEDRQFEGGIGGREARLPLPLLDLYFDPTRRGPYNFNGELGTTFAQNPRDAWGGFVRPIESSYSDFDGQNNVEFVEILLSPLGGINGTEPVTDGAVMYLDLGRLNEDVLPNAFLNSEDGVSLVNETAPEPNSGTRDSWGVRPTGQTNGLVDILDGTERTEDLGLDGLPSTAQLGGATYPLTEADQFADFLAGLPAGTAEQLRSDLDPSADDYLYYLDPRFNERSRYPNGPQGATVQERFGNYYTGSETNSIRIQDAVGGEAGVSLQPDTEDVNRNNAIDTAELLHRYEIPLDEGGLASSPYFLNTLTTFEDEGAPQTWYLLRIPVRTERRETLGGLDRDDFSRVESVRVWTTGHDRPVTVRVASFELVGSRWLKSETVGTAVETGDEPGTGATAPPSLFIESINNEENAAIYAIPRGTLQNTSRSQSGQIRATREAALVFRAENLADGRRAAIVRSYATNPHDLTKYSNLRIATHGDGFRQSDSVRVFVRFGDDETENYYEFEQPLYPFDPDRLVGAGGEPAAEFPSCPLEQPFNCARSDSLWQTNVRVGGDIVDLNPMNIVLSELNRAKLERDQAGRDLDERFTLFDPEGGAPGSRITVRGQPSIQDVRTVVMGVRNAEGGQAMLDTVSVWFNELRVTGYDEAGGASGFLTANMALADVATLNARVSFTDDGFGDLGGALGGRAFARQTAFALNGQFNADKLIPERFGWRIPMSLSITDNASTPRFDPDNGDVRLADLAEAARVNAGEGEGGLDPDIEAERVLERARTSTSSRNVRVQVSKSGSESPWLRYTLDGITASYAASSLDGANPSNRVSDSESWTANTQYRLTVPKPLTVSPFWFTRPVPVLGNLIGGVQLNLLPQNVVLSADARRNIGATQSRLGAQFLAEPDSVAAFRTPVRRTQRFDHGRQIDVRYQPLSFLQMSFASNTDQDLGAAGQREAFRTLVRARDGSFYRVYDLSPTDVRDPGSAAFQDVAAALGLGPEGAFPIDLVEVLGGSDLAVLPFSSTVSNIFAGQLRTRTYTQNATASLRVTPQRQKWLSWLQLQPIAFSANYDWRDQPSATAPELAVSSAGATASVQSSVRIAPRTAFRLFPWYRGLEERAGRTSSRPAPQGRVPGRSADQQDGADSTASGPGFSPLRLARDVFLAVTGVDDISVTYRGSSQTATSGIAGNAYSLFSGLSGAAPPLAYRLGLARSLPVDRRITDDAAFNQFSDLFAARHDIDARTQIQPLRGLSIAFTARTAWSNSEEVDFRIPEGGGEPTSSFGRRSGSGESTVFGFGGSYEAVVARHAERYRRDVEAGGGGPIESEFLSPTGLADDFRSELARGLGAFGPNGLFSLPLPNWSVTYGGLERLPLVRALATQVTLQHGYSASSTTQYATILDRDARSYNFNGSAFAGAAAVGAGGYDEPTAVTVDERFQPLVGLTFGIKGGAQASISTNRSSIYTLQAASAQIYQKRAQDLRLDFSYSRTGMRLFGLRGINNNIRFQFTALVSDDETTTRPFGTDIRAFINGEDLAQLTPQETTRLQLSPRVSYTVSSRVTADLFGSYERTYTQVAGASNRFNGGVSMRILFSN